MLFVAEYDFEWESLDAVMAKRIEWEEVMPDGFRFVGEYIWQEREPPFRGFAVIDADSVEDLNSFVLHYGPCLRVHAHPATDVASGIALVSGNQPKPRRRKKKSA